MSVIKKVLEFVVKNKDADKALDTTKQKTTEISKEVKKTNADFSGLGNTIDKVTGGAISQFKSLGGTVSSTFKGAISSVTGFTSSLGGASTAGRLLTGVTRGLAVALAATGIGLIVAALVGLVEWFRNSREGAKLFEQVLAGLGAVVGQLSTAITALFSGDFAGARDAVLGIKDAVVEAVEAVEAQFEAEDKLFKLRERTIEENAKLEIQQRNLLKISQDTTLSVEERLQAVEELEKVNKQLLDNSREELALEIQVLEQKLKTENSEEKQRDLQLEINRLKAQEIKLEGDLEEISRKTERTVRQINEEEKRRQDDINKKIQERRENERKLAEELLSETEKARIANIKNESERLEEEFRLNIQAIRKKYGEGTQLEEELTIAKNERLKQIEDRRIDEERQRQQTIQNIIDGVNPDELDPFEQLEAEREQALAELDLLRATEEQKLAVIQEFEARKDKLKQDFADAERDRSKAVRDLEIMLAGNAVNAIAGILGEGNKIGQGLAAASALMNTYQGITAALKDPTIPSTTARILQATAVGATGFKAVQDILSTNPTGIGAVPSTNINTPNVGGARFDLATPQQPELDTAPQEVFVTSTQVSSQQSLDRNRQRNTRFS